jgi:hypothetical protein
MEVNTTPNTSTTLTIKEATPTSLEDEARLQNNLKRKKALSSSTKANMKKPKSISDNVTKTKTTKAETQKAVQVPSDTVEKEIGKMRTLIHLIIIHTCLYMMTWLLRRHNVNRYTVARGS